MFRKYVTQFILLLMLSTQLAMAQHATVHFLEDEYIVSHSLSPYVSEKPVDQGKHNQDKICQICLSLKEFSHGFIFTAVDLPVPHQTAGAFTPDLQVAFIVPGIPAYQSRAPPALLS